MNQLSIPEGEIFLSVNSLWGGWEGGGHTTSIVFSTTYLISNFYNKLLLGAT